MNDHYPVIEPLVMQGPAPGTTLAPVPTYPDAMAWDGPPAPAGGNDTCAGLLGLAALGAVVGGAAAAGADLRLMQRNELTTQEALADVGRAAVCSAAATAVAGAVATAVTSQGVTRLAVLFATGAAVMYGLQRGLEQD